MTASIAFHKLAGKAVGGTLGFAVGGPLGAVIGAGLGHAMDAGWLRWRLDSGLRPADPRQQHSAFLFRWLGQLAKADGRVSERDVEAVERLMQRLNLNADERREAVAAFQIGRNRPLDAHQEVTELRSALGGAIDEQALMQGLVGFALKDGKATPAERGVIERLAHAFAWSDSRIAQLMAQRPDGERESLQSAYRTLAIADTANDDEVTRSYRRLLAQHHPDKLQGAGASAEAIAAAQSRTHALRSAYELVMAARSRSPRR